MNWNEVPILAAIVVGFVGFCLMVAAFVLIALQGSWRQAIRPGPDRQWSLPRLLRFAGAFFSIVFSLTVVILFAIPGGIPWSQGSDWSGFAAMLPGLVAVWYFIIRPALASRRHQTAGHQSAQSKARPDG